jgi:hypothetical protein
MGALPPIISPPVIPPQVAAVAEQSLQKYLARCMVLCIVAASLFLIGVIGGVIHYVEQGSIDFGGLFFAAWFVLMSYGAAILLHLRKSEGYLAAFPCMLIMLLLIPVGTIFGILGIMWLNKARPLLKRV